VTLDVTLSLSKGESVTGTPGGANRAQILSPFDKLRVTAREILSPFDKLRVTGAGVAC
jgi:hypothetical protein